MTRSALIAAEAHPGELSTGALVLDNRAIVPLRSLLPEWFTRANEIIKIIGSHNLLTVGSRQQLDDERIAGLIEEFMSGANDTDAQQRMELYRLAWDFVGSSLGSRGELYERNYLQSSRSNRIMAHRIHGLAGQGRGRELVSKVLADARRRR